MYALNPQHITQDTEKRNGIKSPGYQYQVRTYIKKKKNKKQKKETPQCPNVCPGYKAPPSLFRPKKRPDASISSSKDPPNQPNTKAQDTKMPKDPQPETGGPEPKPREVEETKEVEESK